MTTTTDFLRTLEAWRRIREQKFSIFQEERVCKDVKTKLEELIDQRVKTILKDYKL